MVGKKLQSKNESKIEIGHNVFNDNYVISLNKKQNYGQDLSGLTETDTLSFANMELKGLDSDEVL